MGSARQRAIWGPAWEEFYGALWSRAEVANRIRSIADEGLPIHWTAMARRGEWILIRAATYCFGTWRAAVKAAGFNYNEVRTDIVWTKGKVVRAIRALRRKGDKLNSRSAQLSHQALFAATSRKRLFGSWKKAVEASGYSYARVALYEKWEQDRLEQVTEELAEKGVPLNARTILEKNPHFYYAACRRYGSWGKMLKAFGYDPQADALRRSRTREEIIRGIRRLDKEGVHLSDNNVRDTNPALHAAAVRKFKTWVRAREAACKRPGKRIKQRRLFA